MYRRALAAVEVAERIANSIPPSRADLRDELRRAASSVVLNLEEGAAEFSPAEKVRFYRMSRRSAGECLGAIDTLRACGLDAPDADRVKTEFGHVMALMTRLILAVERRRA